jgi:hypothetical protein
MPDPDPAFPLESVFPGTHARHPHIARQEAEDFLEFGGRTEGFDVHDPETRKHLIDGPLDDFIDFEPRLPAELAARLAALPDKWDEQPGADADDHPASILAREIEQWCQLPERLMVFLDGHEARIVPRT